MNSKGEYCVAWIQKLKQGKSILQNRKGVMCTSFYLGSEEFYKKDSWVRKTQLICKHRWEKIIRLQNLGTLQGWMTWLFLDSKEWNIGL